MTNQPYQGGPHEGYDPYQQQWPTHEAQYPQPGHDPELTQQWQGQTWETQTHAPVQAAETAYLPRQDQQPAYPHQYQQPHHQDPHQDPQQYGQQYGQPHAGPYADAHAGPYTDAHAAAYAPEPAPAPAAYEPTPAPPAEPSAGPSAEAEPEYGPATLAGNARITDAQRARLEGRSPDHRARHAAGAAHGRPGPAPGRGGAHRLVRPRRAPWWCSRR